MMTIYAATSNAGKLAEFSASASAEDMTVQALPGLAEMPAPAEDADTFMGNAEAKAVAYSLLAPGLMVFADDSGLEVQVMGGKPGVRSARFAEDMGFLMEGGTRDERNNACLLSNLRTFAVPMPAARFVCALALACDGGVLLRAEGSVAGQIVYEPRGEGGFGYDSLFLLPELGLTMAELPRALKWDLSHRGEAFRRLLEELRKMPGRA